MIIAWLFFRWRFIEPNQVTIQEYNIGVWANTTVALISDIHLWVYKDQTYLQNVVTVINNREDVDMVMIAWDFLYNPISGQTIEELVAPLKDLQKPIYAVLWNHDVGVPWDPTIRLPLVRALEDNWVVILNNDIIWVNNFFLVWIWSYMAWESDTRILDQVLEDESVIVLTHNPDVVNNYPHNKVDLTLAWHTHCGQVRLPLIYNAIRTKILPVEGDFDCGLTEEDNTTLFITPWLWEVMLPIRFNNPPTISILHI